MSNNFDKYPIEENPSLKFSISSKISLENQKLIRNNIYLIRDNQRIDSVKIINNLYDDAKIIKMFDILKIIPLKSRYDLINKLWKFPIDDIEWLELILEKLPLASRSIFVSLFFHHSNAVMIKACNILYEIKNDKEDNFDSFIKEIIEICQNEYIQNMTNQAINKENRDNQGNFSLIDLGSFFDIKL